MSSSTVDHISLSRTLTGSLSLAGSEVKGFAKSLSGSLGLFSTLVEHTSFFRTLTGSRTEEHTSELQSRVYIVCRRLLSLTSLETKEFAKSVTGSLSIEA